MESFGALEVEATKSAAKAVIRFATLRKEGHGQDFGLFSSCRPHSWQPLWCCKVNFCVFQIDFWNFFGQNWNSTVYFENINSERNYNLDNFCWEIFVKLKGDAQLGCKQTLTIFFRLCDILRFYARFRVLSKTWWDTDNWYNCVKSRFQIRMSLIFR